MVERLQGKKIVAVDLDGTLIKGNSLHEYMKVGIKHSKLPVRIILLTTVFLRALRIISHKQMKFTFLKRLKDNDNIKDEFIKKIERIKNKEVIRILSDYENSDYKILLATAALDIYIPWIWKGQYVATQSENNPKRKECRGENKVEEIKKEIGENGDIAVVITDHYDDLPLMRIASEEIILVNPNEKTKGKLSKEGIKYRIL